MSMTVTTIAGAVGEGGRAAHRHAQALGGPHHLDAPGDHQPREWHSRHRSDRRPAASEQTDIGNAVKPFYGNAAGDELTRQLRAHILIAADVIAAAKAGDRPSSPTRRRVGSTNADDIAKVLNSVNPRYWKLPR